MEKMIGYIRVSTEGQAMEGFSLAMQAEKIKQYCSTYNYELVEIVTDAGLSGKSISGRPGIQKVLELISSKKIQNVVIFKLDRLARNLKEACEISDLMKKKGCNLHSISEKIDTGSATGKLFYHMISAMAEWERGVISERVIVGMGQKKAEGGRVSRYAPFGFSFTEQGKVIENPTEQRIISRIFELRKGGYSIRSIEAKLFAEGYKNRVNTKVGKDIICKILKAAA